MGDDATMHDDGVTTTPAQIRSRRERLGISQRVLGERAGRGLSTIQDFELGRHVSAKSRALIAAAMDALEMEAKAPRVPMIEVPESDLRAVLEELRAFRRLYEDDAETLRELAARVERLEAQHGNSRSR